MTRPIPFLPLCCAAAVLLSSPSCTHRSAPIPAEQPPLMAGESRFAPMSQQEEAALQQALAPLLQDAAGAELWYHAAKQKDDGTFAWCVSPAPSEAEWVRISTIPHATLQQLAAERTGIEHGETLDYWMRLELRHGEHKLPVSLCPAEEFGVHIQGCAPLRARAFHKALWNALDKQYHIQKRFDKVVQE